MVDKRHLRLPPAALQRQRGAELGARLQGRGYPYRSPPPRLPAGPQRYCGLVLVGRRPGPGSKLIRPFQGPCFCLVKPSEASPSPRLPASPPPRLSASPPLLPGGFQRRPLRSSAPRAEGEGERVAQAGADGSALPRPLAACLLRGAVLRAAALDRPLGTRGKHVW